VRKKNFLKNNSTYIISEVVCHELGHEHGIAICCSPYGYSTTPMSTTHLKCNNTANLIKDCEFVKNNSTCSRQNYASVTCYNGTRSQTGKHTYSGSLI
jgi:hypothetical protein